MNSATLRSRLDPRIRLRSAGPGTSMTYAIRHIDLGDGRAYVSCISNEEWWLLASDMSGTPQDYGPFKTLDDVIEYTVNNRVKFGLYEYSGMV